MKILMFGRGVIAAIYGWALARAGHQVDFYVRPGRAAEYGASLRMELYDLRKTLLGAKLQATWPIQLREDLPPDHDYDLIFVSVQHYRFAEVAAFLATRASKPRPAEPYVRRAVVTLPQIRPAIQTRFEPLMVIDSSDKVL